MCIICKDWQLGKLTSKEALRNLGEMIEGAENIEKNHYFKIAEEILDKEVPLADNEEEYLLEDEE